MTVIKLKRHAVKRKKKLQVHFIIKNTFDRK